jgi:hypothetical protein
LICRRSCRGWVEFKAPFQQLSSIPCRYWLACLPSRLPAVLPFQEAWRPSPKKSAQWSWVSDIKCRVGRRFESHDRGMNAYPWPLCFCACHSVVRFHVDDDEERGLPVAGTTAPAGTVGNASSTVPPSVAPIQVPGSSVGQGGVYAPVAAAGASQAPLLSPVGGTQGPYAKYPAQYLISMRSAPVLSAITFYLTIVLIGMENLLAHSQNDGGVSEGNRWQADFPALILFLGGLLCATQVGSFKPSYWCLSVTRPLPSLVEMRPASPRPSTALSPRCPLTSGIHTATKRSIAFWPSQHAGQRSCSR